VAPGGRNNYALLLYESGHTDKAIQLLTEGLELGYKNSKLAVNLAYIYMQTGRRTDAEKVIKKYYRKDQDVALDALRPMMYSF
jgi:Flp pilus assembly protein TadD